MRKYSTESISNLSKVTQQVGGKGGILPQESDAKVLAPDHHPQSRRTHRPIFDESMAQICNFISWQWYPPEENLSPLNHDLFTFGVILGEKEKKATWGEGEDPGQAENTCDQTQKQRGDRGGQGLQSIPGR